MHLEVSVVQAEKAIFSKKLERVSFWKPDEDLSGTAILVHIFKTQSVYFSTKWELKNSGNK